MKCLARGQGMAVDLLFAILIFILLLNAALSIWQSDAEYMARHATMANLQSEASQVADMLVRHSGTPDSWETLPISDVNLIGLARMDRVLDSEKVNRFMQLSAAYSSSDYNNAKARLIASREFHLKLTDSSGAGIETGGPAELSGLWSASVRRIVQYGGDTAVAELTLYFPKQ